MRAAPQIGHDHKRTRRRAVMADAVASGACLLMLIELCDEVVNLAARPKDPDPSDGPAGRA
jgi:hypothetical protein